MWIADDSGFSDCVMQHQRAFYFGRSQPVSGHIDDIINPAGNPVVTVCVATSAVASEVIAGVGGKVGLEAAIMVAMDGTNLTRPTLCNNQIAFRCTFQYVAFGIDQGGAYAKEW